MERVFLQIVITTYRLSFAVSHSSTEGVQGESGCPTTLPASKRAGAYLASRFWSAGVSLCLSIWPDERLAG